ncbi:hypothetical protein Tco_0727311 [Tanacetum coccineum]|uniref:Uncharacterized protein n=1 Tax=Tanacetum coccineum TaxID=301880 RepID=A0ABQ4YIM0_9ASTR
MIFKRPVLIPALLCSIGLITNHGHNESDCTVGERKNGIAQLLQSIDQGPFELGPQGDTLGTTPEGGVLLGPEKACTMRISVTREMNRSMQSLCHQYLLQDYPKISTSSSITTLKQKQFGTMSKCFLRDLSSQKKTDNLSCTMSLRGSRCFQNVQGRQNQRYVARGNGVAAEASTEFGLFQGQNVADASQENVQFWNERELLFLAGEQGNTFDADVDNQPVQDLALNEDNIFQADECDAFDSDVDDEPTAQTIFMANLSSAGSANPQAGPSNASILSEVHTLENAIDHSVTNQDEHEIHNEVQQSNVIDSTSVYMGNSNVIPYEQYLSVNNISVVPSCASSTLNNVCVSSDNDAFIPHDPIANELKIYKEQVAIYEQRAKFELTEREQRMDDQMRMLIQNRNKTEENLKKELHSVKLQLNSTMENNKIIEGTVTTLKQELKQKESKFLTDFSNLKHLNDKLENKLHSQDQSHSTTTGQKAQSALYDGDELLKPHHVPEHFEGIQKSLVTEVRAMKAVFENLEAEYQNLKERFGNKKPVTSSNALSFDLLFVIGKLNEQIQSRGNTIRELKEKISRLTEKNSDADPTLDLKALVSQNKDLTCWSSPRQIFEPFRIGRILMAENEKVKQHYKELYDSIKITRAKTTDHNNSLLSEIENLKAQLKDNSKCVTIPDSKPKVLAPGKCLLHSIA